MVKKKKKNEYTDLKYFDFKDHRFYELENDFDPEIHFYQNIDITVNIIQKISLIPV